CWRRIRPRRGECATRSKRLDDAAQKARCIIARERMEARFLELLTKALYLFRRYPVTSLEDRTVEFRGPVGVYDAELGHACVEFELHPLKQYRMIHWAVRPLPA